jgi:hypothetical protein
MKQKLKMLVFIAAIGTLAVASRADFIVTSNNFDADTVGPFNPTYGGLYGYGGGPAVANITNGTVNGITIAGNCVEYTGPAAASGDNYGIQNGNLPLTNNFDPDLTKYTLSFDIALGSGSVNDFTADFVLYSTVVDPVSGYNGGGDIAINTSTLTPGGPWVTETVSLATVSGAGWHNGAINITGTTNFTWSIGKQNGTTVGTADVFIDNIKITTTSTSTGSPTPVSIVAQPTSQTVFAGQGAAFIVSGVGYPAPTYQWKTNGVSVVGATNSSLVLTATTNMSGSLVTVLVSNTYPSSVLSTNNVTLTVVPASGPMVFSSLFASPTGYQQGYGTFTVASGYPAISANVPTGPYAPSGNTASVDFGNLTQYTNQPGGRAINFTNTINASGTPVGNLGALSGFTVCGWLNCASADQGSGGNRIVYCNDGSGSIGFDLATTLDPFNNVALVLGVNQYSDGGTATFPNPISSANVTVDPANGAANWVFFAATYDGTQTSQNVSFYWGNGSTPAYLDYTTDYNRGPVAKSGMLSIGNANLSSFFSTSSGTNAAAYRSWRGLIDEVHVYNSVLSLAQIQAAQVAASSTNVVVIAPTPVPLNISSSGANVILSWTDPTSLFKLATGTNVTGITNVVSTTSPYTNTVSGSQSFFRLVYP